VSSAELHLDQAYNLHPSVAIRPEPFGALVYHYGNRKLVFLKSPRMVAVVKSLDGQQSVSDLLVQHGVPATSRPKYIIALQSLLRSDMIVVSEMACV
jgi:mycofactocin biosynthesis protein MftB